MFTSAALGLCWKWKARFGFIVHVQDTVPNKMRRGNLYVHYLFTVFLSFNVRQSNFRRPDWSQSAGTLTRGRSHNRSSTTAACDSRTLEPRIMTSYRLNVSARATVFAQLCHTHRQYASQTDFHIHQISLSLPQLYLFPDSTQDLCLGTEEILSSLSVAEQIIFLISRLR